MYSGLNNDNPGPSYYNPEIKSNKGCINWKR